MFQNLKVLELASVLAGPSVGQFFAELGAEVIKVENLRTGGDVTRSWKTKGENEGDLSAYFCCCNWGKKSIAVDLTTDQGNRIVQKLAAQSDVIIASYKPGDAEKLGVAYEQLKANNEQLIYGQITGYGADDDRVGYDAVIQAESGFMELNGEKDGPPTKMPVALIDLLAGHQLKEAILLALLKKERTGAGSLVEVSLLQTAIASLANQATNWLVANKLPTRQGSAHPNIAPYGESFLTKDGKRILLAVGNDKQFQALATVLGKPELAQQPIYKNNENRVANRTSLNEILSPLIKQLDGIELVARLSESKVPAGLIQTVSEVLETPSAKGLIIRDNEMKGVRTFVGTGFGAGQLLSPPHVGQHTDEVLKMIR